MSEQACNEVARVGALTARDSVLELYQIAVLMLGNEEEAASLVEEAVAHVQADPCTDSAAANAQARSRLGETAVRRLARLHPDAFSVPPAAEAASGCIDAEDLNAAGLTGEELSVLVQGPGRIKIRGWLEQLAPAMRAVFVLRAVAGQDGERTAESLRRSGAEGAQGWKREQVGTAYRQALCSLATSLISSQPAGILA
jgi:DNA-directed RNA polymerase specialized sigma24 family protein